MACDLDGMQKVKLTYDTNELLKYIGWSRDGVVFGRLVWYLYSLLASTVNRIALRQILFYRYLLPYNRFRGTVIRSGISTAQCQHQKAFLPTESQCTRPPVDRVCELSFHFPQRVSRAIGRSSIRIA